MQVDSCTCTSNTDCPIGEQCKSRRIESKGKGLLQKQKAQLDFFTARRKTPALVRTKSGLNDNHAKLQERQEQMREEARRRSDEVKDRVMRRKVTSAAGTA